MIGRIRGTLLEKNPPEILAPLSDSSSKFPASAPALLWPFFPA